MRSTEYVKTGIKKLDKMLGGGIQKGFTTCITGVPGTNMEIIAKQLASKGETIFITTNETKDEIMETMKRFKWENKHLKIIDLASTYLEYVKQNASLRTIQSNIRSRKHIRELIKLASTGVPSKETREPDFLNMFLSSIQRFSSKKIVLDSLDFLLRKYPWRRVIKALHASRINIAEEKGVLFFTLTRGIHGEKVERELEELVDCVIELNIMRGRTSFERYLSVKKIKNQPESIKSARYDVTSEGVTLESIERI